MKRAHLITFLAGTIFWALAFSLVHSAWGLFAGSPVSFWSTFGLYVAATLVVSLVLQELFGGFPVVEPFLWFFYPLGSWVVFLVAVGFQTFMM